MKPEQRLVKWSLSFQIQAYAFQLLPHPKTDVLRQPEENRIHGFIHSLLPTSKRFPLTSLSFTLAPGTQNTQQNTSSLLNLSRVSCVVRASRASLVAATREFSLPCHFQHGCCKTMVKWFLLGFYWLKICQTFWKTLPLVLLPNVSFSVATKFWLQMEISNFITNYIMKIWNLWTWSRIK